MASTKELIKYIVGELSDRGLDFTKTTLVKLIYIADIEALRSGLPRISNLRWIFYKYGPYAFDFDEALRDLTGTDIDELAGFSTLGRPFFAYRRSPREEPARIPVEAKAVINRVLDRWGGESLNKILNYVYFETEPMQEAEWGKPLNLDMVRRRETLVRLADLLATKASPERAEHLRRLKEEFWSRAPAPPDDFVEPLPAPRYDEVFFEGLRATDEEA
jgi:hypothetical protein